MTKDEAREIFKNDPYKLELIEEHSEDEGGLTIYRQGEYVDLCRGPHVPSTGRIQIFHLLHEQVLTGVEMRQRYDATYLWYSLV